MAYIIMWNYQAWLGALFCGSNISSPYKSFRIISSDLIAWLRREEVSLRSRCHTGIYLSKKIKRSLRNMTLAPPMHMQKQSYQSIFMINPSKVTSFCSRKFENNLSCTTKSRPMLQCLHKSSCPNDSNLVNPIILLQTWRFAKRSTPS
mgnify:CR=1 FL=1